MSAVWRSSSTSGYAAASIRATGGPIKGAIGTGVRPGSTSATARRAARSIPGRESTSVPSRSKTTLAIAAGAGGGEGRAFVLVTAGPGLTQVVTALGGAYLESRELLVIGGQVKSSDLIGDSGVRQRGIQEIDGVAIAAPVCAVAERIAKPIDR